MTNNFLKQGMRGPLLSLAALALLASATLTWAEPALKPYRAVYHIDTGKLSSDAVRELTQHGEHEWRLSTEASLLFFRLQEEARMLLRDGELHPIRYTYEQTAGGRRNIDLRFDWTAMLVTNRNPRDNWQIGLAPGVQDRLGSQLQLQLDLINGNFEHKDSYPVVNRGRIREYQIELVGEEVLDTPVGKLRTLKLRQYRADRDRETLVWTAPDWNYLLVKMEHSEDDDSYKLELKSATVDGRTVVGQP